MKTISMKKHIGKDGILNLSIPTNEKETDVEIVLIIETKNKSDEWGNFFKETYGAFKSNKLSRADQGEYPQREELI
jgi:hypothetical protein